MNAEINGKTPGIELRNSRGMTMLDVLLAIVIFVIGMLALASLQTNLTRSSVDANARTMGTNIAEELIEQLRTFEVVRTTTGKEAYQDIVNFTDTVTRGGIAYNVNVTVDDYYFLSDAVTVTRNTGDLPSNRDTTISDFKYVELAVNWTGAEFLVDEGNTTGDRLGSGSITLSTLIPSIPQLGSAKIAAEEEDTGSPPVPYMPGERPDIIAIDLNGSKFKESTTPVPEVIRADELVETWFDVITYNQITGGDSTEAIYLRREEFVVLTCECTLHEQPGDLSPTGFMPTVWNGVEYVTGNNGAMVSKAYGTSASNQQSFYCDTCCRDHHDLDADSTNPDELYDPARLSKTDYWSEAGGVSGDHKHFTRANKGGLSEAVSTDKYVEACRMVRKDGFMRVAQDFRQEGLLSFPAGYLDTSSGAEYYSDYITDAVTDFYAKNRDELAPPSGVTAKGVNALWSAGSDYDFPADKTDGSGAYPIDGDITTLPLLGLESQQMRSRSLYIDHQSTELKTLLTCLQNEIDKGVEDPGTACNAPGITDPLQVMPFYEVQSTWLAWWNTTPPGIPVSITNEAVNDNNSHSRALAVLESSDPLPVEVDTTMHRGNIGLTVTDPITLAESDESVDTDGHNRLYMEANGGGEGIPPNYYAWTAHFGSSVNKVDAASVIITDGNNSFCSRTSTTLTCASPSGVGSDVTFSGYTLRQGQNWVPLYICAEGFPGDPDAVVNTAEGANNSAVLSWPAGTAGTSMVISIEDSDCTP